MRRSTAQLNAINYAIAERNAKARSKAIADAGLLPAFTEYSKAHKYVSSNHKQADFCKIHKLDWRKYL